MSSPTDLWLDWCSHEAAKYAVVNWHYSRTMPASKVIKIGVWESQKFIGCVLFNRGANKFIGRPYGLTLTQVCELVRVALTKHEAPTSRIVSIAIRLLHKSNPGIKLIISYADSAQGHHGGIYQAGNWIFVGSRTSEQGVRVKGRIRHRRSLNSLYGTSDLSWLRQHVDPLSEVVVAGVKHKYLMPLDKSLRFKLMKLAKPYPMRRKC